MAWIILIAIYVASAVTWYYSVRHQFTYEYKGLSPGWFEVAVIFIPFINTMWSFFYWSIYLLNLIEVKSKIKFKWDFNKFFGIK